MKPTRPLWETSLASKTGQSQVCRSQVLFFMCYVPSFLFYDNFLYFSDCICHPRSIRENIQFHSFSSQMLQHDSMSHNFNIFGAANRLSSSRLPASKLLHGTECHRRCVTHYCCTAHPCYQNHHSNFACLAGTDLHCTYLMPAG